jgi:hypothetical protein
MTPLDGKYGILIPIAFGISAFLLVLDKITQPIFITTDLSVQIEAALNLLNGDGLGNFALFNDAFNGLQIAIKPLTHFPPGMSLILMALLKLGLPLVVALKFIYSVATLLGWLLWGTLFRNVIFAPAILYNKATYWLLFITAIFTGALFPLLYTLQWNGTDLLLWSLIPYLILLLLSGSEKEGRKQNIDFFCGGLLVGFLYFIRYLSIFLVLAFIIYSILQKYQFKKYLYFLSGFSIFYIIIAAYKHSQSLNALSWWKLSPISLLDLTLLKQKINVIFSPYTISNLVKNLAALLVGPWQTWSSLSWLPIILLLMLAFFSLISAKILSRSQISWHLDIRRFFSICYLATAMITSIVLLILSVKFLASSANDYNLFEESRYFYVLFPVLLLLSMHMFRVTSDTFYCANLISRFSRPKRIILWAAMNISGICLLTALSFTFILAKNVSLYSHLQSFLPSYFLNARHGWNHSLQTRTPESGQALQTLMQRNSDVFTVSFAEDFDFSHTVNDQVRRRFVLGPGKIRLGSEPFEVWPNPITSKLDNTKAKHFYFIFRSFPNCKSYCYYDTGIPVDFTSSISQFKLVYSNPKERVNIFEARLQQ